MVDGGRSTCTVNDEIGYDEMAFPGLAVDRALRSIRFLNAFHIGLGDNLSPHFEAAFEQHLYEVGVIHFQLACTAVGDRHLSPRPRSDMGELERDVAATDDGDPAGQFG